MRILVAVAALAASVAGAQPAGPVRCDSAEHCEALMVAAQRHLQVATGMRLRMVGANRLETFTANGYGLMTGVVTKAPVGGGAYDIAVEFECYRGTQCDKQRRDSMAGFYSMLALETKAFHLRAASSPEPAASK